MFVNQKDKLKELSIISLIKNAGLLDGVNIYPSQSQIDIFDFYGYIFGDKVISIDIKSREIASTDYPSYYISKEKYNESRKEGTFWIIYEFTKDQIVKIFDLGNLRLESKKLNFIHKRSGQLTNSLIYLIPSESWLYRLKY